MATYWSQLPPRQVCAVVVGIAPVISSLSTFWNDTACWKSFDLQ